MPRAPRLRGPRGAPICHGKVLKKEEKGGKERKKAGKKEGGKAGKKEKEKREREEKRGEKKENIREEINKKGKKVRS